MHPILARPGRVVAYMAVWLPLGVLLAALLALQGVFGWIEALLVAVALGRRPGVVPAGGADALRVRLSPLSARDGGELSRRGAQRLARRGAPWPRITGAGARGGTARAAGADRSAFPVQQPAVDQRADDGRAGGGAA